MRVCSLLLLCTLVDLSAVDPEDDDSEPNGGRLRLSRKSITFQEVDGTECSIKMTPAGLLSTCHTFYKKMTKNSFWQSVLAWKGLLTPRFLTHWVGAHVRDSTLLSPNIAYLTHKSFDRTCDSECCCDNSPCSRASRQT